jgi:hypothetical protein
MFVLNCECGHESEHDTLDLANAARGFHCFDERHCDSDSYITEEPTQAGILQGAFDLFSRKA